MKKLTILLLLFAVSSGYAWDFKVKGSSIYYKSKLEKEYSECDYFNFTGKAIDYDEKLNPIWLFKDDSDIERVVQDRLNKILYIQKTNSHWCLYYDDSTPQYWRIVLKYPNLSDNQFKKKNIRQIYP